MKVAIFTCIWLTEKPKEIVLKLTHKMHNLLLQTGAKHGVDWIIRDGAF